MKKYNDLRDLKGNVRASIQQLINYGTTCTGRSGYSKGWASKSVWTADVVKACEELGIVVEAGNDAPKGGANGEYVRLVADKRKNRNIWAAQKAAKAAKEKLAADIAAAKDAQIAFLKDNASRLKTEKPNIATWSQYLTAKLNAAGFNVFYLSFNEMKSYIF